MVEHNIEYDLNAVLVKLLDHALELVGRHVELACGRIAGLGGEEADCAVAPVVEQPVALIGPLALLLVELEDGKKLHAVDAQLLEIRDLLHHTPERPAVGDA